MSVVFAIDPGTTESGVVELDVEENVVLRKRILSNTELLELLSDGLDGVTVAVLEFPVSYFKPVGREVFVTLAWIGRFTDRLLQEGVDCRYLNRKKIAQTLCKTARANDSAVRQACIDRFQEFFPGQSPIGTTKNPGPLFGIVKHLWSALAVSLAAVEIGVHNVQTADSYLLGGLSPEISALADCPPGESANDVF